MKIYLDYAATTFLDPKVLAAMLPYLKKDFGNASSLHSFGQKASQAVEKAREQVADFLNCSYSEIVFAGSATEANNLAIFGVVKAAQKKGVAKPHIITTKIEHHAVLEPCHILEKSGLAEVSYLPVGKEGIVRAEDVKKAIKPNTVLVSIMYANNEIGTVQPIAQIANLIRDFKNPKFYILNSKSLVPVFHTDAVQAINYLDCDVQKLGVDILTLSGHKIYGPKGIGALYVRKGVALEPIIFGGGQEQGLRSGTENVAGIVGLGEAIRKVSSSKFQVSRIRRLRDKLINGILKTIPRASLSGSLEHRLPNNVNMSIAGVEGESLVMTLDQKGIAASTGSACSSKSLKPSHVLIALGLSYQKAHGSLRMTLGRYTTEQEIEYVLKVLPKVVERLRKISGQR